MLAEEGNTLRNYRILGSFGGRLTYGFREGYCDPPPIFSVLVLLCLCGYSSSDIMSKIDCTPTLKGYTSFFIKLWSKDIRKVDRFHFSDYGVNWQKILHNQLDIDFFLFSYLGKLSLLSLDLDFPFKGLKYTLAYLPPPANFYEMGPVLSLKRFKEEWSINTRYDLTVQTYIVIYHS